MRSVEMLERLKELAEDAGYTVRHEWLGGVGGGACEFAGRKWIFIDLSLPVIEQLDQIALALQDDPAATMLARADSELRHAALAKAA
jgi:hypothetical protein